VSSGYRAWFSVRSYFARGRLAGMDEATREFIKGIRAHCMVRVEAPLDRLTKAIGVVGVSARGALEEHPALSRQALDRG